MTVRKLPRGLRDDARTRKRILRNFSYAYDYGAAMNDWGVRFFYGWFPGKKWTRLLRYVKHKRIRIVVGTTQFV